MKRLSVFTAGMAAGAALLWWALGLEGNTDDGGDGGIVIPLHPPRPTPLTPWSGHVPPQPEQQRHRITFFEPQPFVVVR